MNIQTTRAMWSLPFTLMGSAANGWHKISKTPCLWTYSMPCVPGKYLEVRIQQTVASEKTSNWAKTYMQPCCWERGPSKTRANLARAHQAHCTSGKLMAWSSMPETYILSATSKWRSIVCCDKTLFQCLPEPWEKAS